MTSEEKYMLVDSYLEDDFSRFILKERHLYNQDKSNIHIRNIVKSIKEYNGTVYYPGMEENLVNKVRKVDTPLYIWGGWIQRSKDI